MFAAPVILLAIAITGCQDAFKPVGAALEAKEPARALRLLDDLRSQCSASATFHELTGLAHELSGDFPAAAEELQRALTMNPQLAGDPTLLLWLAQALLETNQSARLATLLSNKSSLSPALLFTLGTLFAKHGDYRQAIAYLRRVPAESADDALYFNLGLAYSHLRQFDEARRCYFQAIDQQSGLVDAYLRVGLDFAASGDLRKAVPWLLRAHSLDSKRPDIVYSLVEQLIVLDYLDTAGQIVTETLAADPRDPLLLLANGDVLLARGNTAEAAGWFKNALEQMPKLPGAMVGLARIAMKQGDAGEARRLLQEAFALDPEDTAVNSELGSLDLNEGRWEDAVRHFSKAWASDESNPTNALRLAQALRHLNRAEDAFQIVKPLTSTLSQSSAVHFELAQIYSQLHRAADARAERDEAAGLQAKTQGALHFDNPKTYVH